MPTHPCPCCGHRTLTDPPPGTHQICSVCCWQDVGPGAEVWSETTHRNLREAQRTFEAIGACDPHWVGTARAPSPDEARDPGWITLDVWEAQHLGEALQAIDDAFGALRVGDGMRVYDAELADSYGRESAISDRVKHLDYQRYDEVPDDIVADYYWVLSFFDPPSLRLHLATYMAWTLREGHRVGSNSVGFTLYALTPNDSAPCARQEQRLGALDRAQAQAVVTFLELMAVRADPEHQTALAALGFWRERVRALGG